MIYNNNNNSYYHHQYLLLLSHHYYLLFLLKLTFFIVYSHFNELFERTSIDPMGRLSYKEKNPQQLYHMPNE